MLYILGLLVVGLFVGAVARLVVRSPQRLGCLGTALLGIIGSYAGGSLASILFHDKFDLRKASSLIGAIVGSILLLLIWRVFSPEGRRSRR
jgi:uncharacterized membrane protein YeaQ/YmgE (transglycosylase-associated protein family)